MWFAASVLETPTAAPCQHFNLTVLTPGLCTHRWGVIGLEWRIVDCSSVRSEGNWYADKQAQPQAQSQPQDQYQAQPQTSSSYKQGSSSSSSSSGSRGGGWFSRWFGRS